jgi:flavin reductase (DIM6/NTAB) family NADH-FMN oxidoreductase RutF
MGVDAEQFKAAMSVRAAGVAIVTSREGGRVHGMTVSDLCGVSLHPPRVLVCADKSSETHALIQRSGIFAASLLAADQEALARRFASKEDEYRRFEGLHCDTAVTGAPLIPGAVASFDCRVVACHDAGDHVIYVGEVEAIQRGEGAPLVYYASRYRRLAGR